MISALIKTWLAPYEAYIWAGLAVLLLAGGLYEVHRQREIGRAEVIAADATARADEHAKVVKLQAQLQAVADKAEGDRDATQKQLDDYRAAHPTGAVFVCHRPGDRVRGAGANASPNPSDAIPSAGPAVIPEVPGGTETDVGANLDALVRAAEVMGGLYRQYQQQPVIGGPDHR